MIKEDWEKKLENDKIRMRIIDDVMKIRSKEKLDCIKRFSGKIYAGEIHDIPLDIISLAETLDIRDIIRVLDALEKTDMHQFAAVQMKEAFEMALEQYIGADEED